MGFIKDAKVGGAVGDAARAATEGRTVFLYRFNVPATSSGFSGPVSGAAEVIEGVEHAGWRLDSMAYDGAQSKNGAALLLFRRNGEPRVSQDAGTAWVGGAVPVVPAPAPAYGEEYSSREDRIARHRAARGGSS